MDQTSYAGKVKGLALLLGLGRRNFAKILNVDESTLRAWEQGKNLPTKKRRAEIDFLIDKCLTKQQRVIASSSRGVCA